MDSLCDNITRTKEIETLFLSFLGPFGIFWNDNKNLEKNFDRKDFEKEILESKNKYSSCLGFLMTFFNNRNECPKTKENKTICMYSKNIKIYFDGGNDESEKKSECGTSAVSSITEFDFDDT